MNAQNFTQKSIEALQSAQSLAQAKRSSNIAPEHLLYALTAQDGGLIPSLLGRMGVDCGAVLTELEEAINSMPRLGSAAEVYLAPETGRVVEAAENSAKSLGDEYISVEHLMLGLFAAGGANIKRIFSDHGITKSAFAAELAKVKSGPVTGDNPEGSYDALTKYGSDLVKRARETSLTRLSAGTARYAMLSASSPAKPRITPCSSVNRAWARQPLPRAWPSV